jgi:nitroreductase
LSALEAVRNRHSHSKVTAEAPSRLQLLPLVEAAATVADHSGLRPWRLIELRGDARVRLGAALAEASGLEGKDAAKAGEKPLRASLLIAVVFSPRPSFKVPAVHRMHELAPSELLLGWLYVGGLPPKLKAEKPNRFEAGRYLTELT